MPTSRTASSHDWPSITVLVVSYWSTFYLNYLYRNLHERASGKSNVAFVIVDNTHGADSRLHEFIESKPDVELMMPSPHNLKGAQGHAAALDHAMGFMASDYTLICDPDVYVFQSDWDTFLINQLADHNADSIGVPYPSWRVGTYHDFPSPVFHFFRTSALASLDIPWKPFATKKHEKLLNFLGRQIMRFGGLINRERFVKYHLLREYASRAERLLGVRAPDTGYLIANAARVSGLRRVMLDLVERYHPDWAQLLNSHSIRELAQQYELYLYKGRPILTHKYGTSAWIWRTSKGRDKGYWIKMIELAEQELDNKKQQRQPMTGHD